MGGAFATKLRHPRRSRAVAETALPKIGVPATRALAAIGVTTLDKVVERSESELLALHGVGPRAVRVLKEALAAQGMELRR